MTFKLIKKKNVFFCAKSAVQENNMTELNNLFAKIDDRRRVSATLF